MVYNGPMERTQIYLDEEQKRKLRLIAADEGGNVSDLIRSAIDRLLDDRFPTVDRLTKYHEVRKRIVESLDGGATDEEIEAAFRRMRALRRETA